MADTLTPYQEWQLTHTCMLPDKNRIGPSWATCQACITGPPPACANEVAQRQQARELAQALNPPSTPAVTFSTTVAPSSGASFSTGVLHGVRSAAPQPTSGPMSMAMSLIRGAGIVYGIASVVVFTVAVAAGALYGG